MRGYWPYLSMLSATLRQMWRKVPVEPVKWIPARRGSAIIGPATGSPSPGRKLTTPSGNPASVSRRITYQLDRAAVVEGFQIAVLPSSAGAVGRLPAIEVKLNGVMASTKPSRGRCSSLFQQPGADSGCSA
jgi:hypothetical protein